MLNAAYCFEIYFATNTEKDPPIIAGPSFKSEEARGKQLLNGYETEQSLFREFAIPAGKYHIVRHAQRLSKGYALGNEVQVYRRLF